MPLTCPQCGAENRDSAKFCLKCAQQLVSLPSSSSPKNAKRRKRRRSNTLHALYVEFVEDAPSPPWRLLAIVGLLLGSVALWAIMVSQRSGIPPVHSIAPPSSNASQAASADPALPETHQIAASASAPLPEPLAQAAAFYVEPVSEQAPSPVSSPLPPPRTNRHTARPAPTPAPAPPPTPLSPAPAPEPAPAPPPEPAPIASRPTTLCADSRFIAHAICLQAECDKPSRRQHPQCVQMREQQEALRRTNN